MSKIELFSIDLSSQWFTVHNDTTLFGKIISAPNIMVTGKEMYFYSHIRQLGNFPQETGVTLRYDQPEFIPEVEHISQQINGS